MPLTCMYKMLYGHMFSFLFGYTPSSEIAKMITNLKSAFMTLMKSLNYTDILS